MKQLGNAILEVINQPEKKERRLVAIDETVIKMGNERIYVWIAIDVDTKECLAVSKGRSRIEVYTFLKKYFNIVKTSQK